jgi:hypothetical protein
MNDPYNTATMPIPDVIPWDEPSIEETQPIRIALFVNRVSEDSQGERNDKSRILKDKNNS